MPIRTSPTLWKVGCSYPTRLLCLFSKPNLFCYIEYILFQLDYNPSIFVLSFNFLAFLLHPRESAFLRDQQKASSTADGGAGLRPFPGDMESWRRQPWPGGQGPAASLELASLWEGVGQGLAPPHAVPGGQTAPLGDRVGGSLWLPGHGEEGGGLW